MAVVTVMAAEMTPVIIVGENVCAFFRGERVDISGNDYNIIYDT